MSLWDNYVLMLIKVRLCGSAWHGSQQCVRNWFFNGSLGYSHKHGISIKDWRLLKFTYEITISWTKIMNSKWTLLSKPIKQCLKGYEAAITDPVEFHDKPVTWSWKVKSIYISFKCFHRCQKKKESSRLGFLFSMTPLAMHV